MKKCITIYFSILVIRYIKVQCNSLLTYNLTLEVNTLQFAIKLCQEWDQICVFTRKYTATRVKSLQQFDLFTFNILFSLHTAKLLTIEFSNTYTIVRISKNQLDYDWSQRDCSYAKNYCFTAAKINLIKFFLSTFFL